MPCINLVFNSEDMKKIAFSADVWGVSVQKYIIDAANDKAARDVHMTKRNAVAFSKNQFEGESA